jgi:hypothetical protein
MSFLNVAYRLITGKTLPLPVLADQNGALARPPNIRLVTDKTIGSIGGQSPAVSGSIANKAGGTSSGSGFTAGSATISGGAITAIAVSSGGSGYPISARLKVTISGDGSGAAGYANSNASGVITSITITSGGTGYTTASCTIDVVSSPYTVIFDLGPDWGNYSSAVLSVANAPNAIYRLYFLHSDDGVTPEGFCCLASGVDAYIDGVGGSGALAREVKISARYTHVVVNIGISTASGAKFVFTAMA